MKDRFCIANINESEKDFWALQRPGLAFGDPVATKKFSVEELKNQGFVGVYGPEGQTAEDYHGANKFGQPAAQAPAAPAKPEFPFLAAMALAAYCQDPQMPSDVRIAAKELSTWLDG